MSDRSRTPRSADHSHPDRSNCRRIACPGVQLTGPRRTGWTKSRRSLGRRALMAIRCSCRMGRCRRRWWSVLVSAFRTVDFRGRQRAESLIGESCGCRSRVAMTRSRHEPTRRSDRRLTIPSGHRPTSLSGQLHAARQHAAWQLASNARCLRTSAPRERRQVQRSRWRASAHGWWESSGYASGGGVRGGQWSLQRRLRQRPQ